MPEIEQEWVDRSLPPAQAFRAACHRLVVARLLGDPHTLDLLAAEGCDYVCDWVNDDMPYPLQTKAGPLHAMPHAYEISDLQLFAFHKYKPTQFVEQVMDHFELLYREAARAGGDRRAVAQPWISGVPHRIAAVEEVLDRMLAHAVYGRQPAPRFCRWRAQQ